MMTTRSTSAPTCTTRRAPAGVTTRLVRRDADFDSDFLQIVIDGYHDHLSRAFFNVNPSGSKEDLIGIGTSCCDPSWDPVWEAVTRIDSTGWTAEVRIPFSQLRFSRDSVQTWGLEVRRFIKRRNEQDDWATWAKTDAGGPSRFGHLTGLRIPPSTSHLELLPYVVERSASLASQAGSPFDTHGRPTARVGLDLKDRLTSNLTLDATINPDFGQVEVDPAVLNLSALETFFPEKRPFFIEGAQVFDFGNQSCNFCSYGEGMTGFYSRRIGRAPTGADLAVDNFAHADVPDATTILGAGKITGRTKSGYTVGLLDALTGRETARVQDFAGQRGTQEVEPLADYLAGRVKRDFLGGNLVVGGMVSGVARNIDSTFAPRLARHAEMLGNDVVYAWGNKTYDVTADWALTNVSGDRREIALREQSSARYLQRPDRGTAIGTSSTARTTRRPPRCAAAASTPVWPRRRGAGSARSSSTGARRATRQTTTRFSSAPTTRSALSTSAGCGAPPRGGITRSSPSPAARPSATSRATGRARSSSPSPVSRRRSSGTSRRVLIHRPVVLDDQALRGGPLVLQPASDFASISVQHGLAPRAGRRRQRRRLRGPARNGESECRAHCVVSAGAEREPVVRPVVERAAHVRAVRAGGDRHHGPAVLRHALRGVRLSPAHPQPRHAGQRHLQPDDDARAVRSALLCRGALLQLRRIRRAANERLFTYGRDRGTISAATGADGIVTQYTVDPDGAGPAAPFTIANPDLSEQSLRGNAVFRWEYRPGSVLYVAWTQSRLGDSAFGDLSFPRDRIALLAARPDNIFLVKLSWWLPR